MIARTGAIAWIRMSWSMSSRSSAPAKPLFETILNKAEADGEFRRLIPLEQVGFDTPYVLAHPNHPYFKVPAKPEDD
jgi:hypothetical protein